MDDIAVLNENKTKTLKTKRKKRTIKEIKKENTKKRKY